LLTSVIGAVTLVSYLFIYTPLKRMTWLNTIVGAVPGALPPVMGWTAARGELSGEGWALFAILALWQMPHFMSIAWIYRDEYAKAGFKMLPVVDPDGCRTGQQAVSHALALLFVSLCPFVFKMAGTFYLAGALILGAGYLWCAFHFLRQLRFARAELTLVRARQLFLASIIYLPLLLALMVWDKMK
jgi:protoheme IX farnesyltransferase